MDQRSPADCENDIVRPAGAPHRRYASEIKTCSLCLSGKWRKLDLLRENRDLLSSDDVRCCIKKWKVHLLIYTTADLTDTLSGTKTLQTYNTLIGRLVVFCNSDRAQYLICFFLFIS